MVKCSSDYRTRKEKTVSERHHYFHRSDFVRFSGNASAAFHEAYPGVLHIRDIDDHPPEEWEKLGRQTLRLRDEHGEAVEVCGVSQFSADLFVLTTAHHPV
ncbi:MAG TPA: hypothetical protein VJ837_03445 [Candidatus Paceibacterota bacterium]|nr:hypothetical protein [Candidatus Paceibacterota bacterium]